MTNYPIIEDADKYHRDYNRQYVREYTDPDGDITVDVEGDHVPLSTVSQPKPRVIILPGNYKIPQSVPRIDYVPQQIRPQPTQPFYQDLLDSLSKNTMLIIIVVLLLLVCYLILGKLKKSKGVKLKAK